MRLKNKYAEKGLRMNHAGICIPAYLAVLIISCTSPERKQSSTTGADSSVIELLAQSPGHTVLSLQSTIQFGKKTTSHSISVNGIIVPDERRSNTIAARFGGRIEKLYVRFPFQYVRKGEKLLDLYSPDLNTIISEYLFLRAKDKTSLLTQQARQKLILLGLEDSQIKEFEKTGKVPSSVSIYSPYNGYVTSSEPATISSYSTSENSGSGMSGMNPANENIKDTPASSSRLREGGYVAAGQTLFMVNDAREVIALLSLDPDAQANAATGMQVVIASELLPGQKLNGTIDLIEPVLQNGQRFLNVRAKLSNSNDQLKFNSLVKAEIELPANSINELPSSCVFDLGKRKIAWVRSDSIGAVSVFTPRIVITGNDDGTNIRIISGLQPGEIIALDAGLLVDREGIIQTDLK